MKHDKLLTIASLIAIVLMSLHLADDVMRGIEPGGLENLRGMGILAVMLFATLVPAPRRWAYVVLLLGSLLAAVMSVTHFSGRGVGGAFAASDGAYFSIWLLLALGVTGAFATVLSVAGLWSLRGARKPS